MSISRAKGLVAVQSQIDGLMDKVSTEGVLCLLRKYSLKLGILDLSAVSFYVILL